VIVSRTALLRAASLQGLKLAFEQLALVAKLHREVGTMSIGTDRPSVSSGNSLRRLRSSAINDAGSHAAPCPTSASSRRPIANSLTQRTTT
jgi:hypothetical protein